MGFVELTKTLDINQTTVGTTDTDQFSGVPDLALFIKILTGPFGSVVLVFECSSTGLTGDWVPIKDKAGVALVINATTIAAAGGLFTDVELFKVRHCRVRPSTGSGSAATATIILSGIAPE